MKQFSSKKSIQILAHILKEYEINDVVISPGSRNAPIAIHFAEMDEFNCFSIIDERSAGFVGLGMAKSTERPVIITCTSGTAAANYYPAIIEAFYQNVPLIVITADRPTEFVDLFDGQTIRQKNLYQQHSYGDFELLEDKIEGAEEQNWEMVKKAVEICLTKRGPVHINVPLEEPLYHLVSEIPFYPSVEKTIQTPAYELPGNLVADWNTSKRIMFLVGTINNGGELNALLSQFVKNHSTVVLCEANSNLHYPKFFNHIDRYIFNFEEDDYKRYAPDLLITIGQNVVSKKVKEFLRKAHPAKHWHVDPVWQPDTYFSLTQKVETKPEVFLSLLLGAVELSPNAYYNLWDVLREKADSRHTSYGTTVGFSDFTFFKILSESIPKEYAVHFSNSSAIRYAQLFEFQNDVYCNRGTSGIEGCTSTAVGFAIKHQGPTVLVTGDLSFFYDSNGLWNQYIPPFMRIIVFNNEEGNIFRIIPGPENANDSVLEEFIATKHHRTAENTAKTFGFLYTKVEDEDSLSRVMENFFKASPQPKLLEVNTAREDNARILRAYFQFLQDK